MEKIINPYYKYLLFHVYGQKIKRWTLQDELVSIMKKMGAEYKKFKLHNTKNLIKHLDLYNKCDEFIGMPFHSIILAHLYDVSYSIPFNYHDKIKKIFVTGDVEKHYKLLEDVL